MPLDSIRLSTVDSSWDVEADALPQSRPLAAGTLPPPVVGAPLPESMQFAEGTGAGASPPPLSVAAVPAVAMMPKRRATTSGFSLLEKAFFEEGEALTENPPVIDFSDLDDRPARRAPVVSAQAQAGMVQLRKQARTGVQAARASLVATLRICRTGILRARAAWSRVDVSARWRTLRARLAAAIAPSPRD